MHVQQDPSANDLGECRLTLWEVHLHSQSEHTDRNVSLSRAVTAGTALCALGRKVGSLLMSSLKPPVSVSELARRQYAFAVQGHQFLCYAVGRRLATPPHVI